MPIPSSFLAGMLENSDPFQVVSLGLLTLCILIMMTSIAHSIYSRLTFLKQASLGDPSEDARQYFPLGEQLVEPLQAPHDESDHPHPQAFGLPEGFSDSDIYITVLLKHLDLSPLEPTFTSAKIFTVRDVLNLSPLRLLTVIALHNRHAAYNQQIKESYIPLAWRAIIAALSIMDVPQDARIFTSLLPSRLDRMLTRVMYRTAKKYHEDGRPLPDLFTRFQTLTHQQIVADSIPHPQGIPSSA